MKRWGMIFNQIKAPARFLRSDLNPHRLLRVCPFWPSTFNFFFLRTEILSKENRSFALKRCRSSRCRFSSPIIYFLLFSEHNLSCKLFLPFRFIKFIVLVIRLLKFLGESSWEFFLNLILVGCNFWNGIANLIHITSVIAAQS